MKQVIFSCLSNGKKVTGNWLCETRPSKPIDIVDRLVRGKITNLKSFVKDIKVKMINTVNEEE